MREDFPIFKNNPNLIYFDNGATTLKPQIVIDGINDYYTKYTANAHRGDYDNSLKVDLAYEGTRKKVQEFINALKVEEIVFTKGTTDSLNMIVFGFMKYHLKRGDEVLITKAEHASNVLPWLELQNEIGIVVKYIELDNLKVTKENVIKAITPNTKVISLAQISNVVGDIRPIKEISKIANERNIYLVVDAAQSIPHMRVDVRDLDVDFLAFSGHKMLGPTGVGVLYGKFHLLDKLKPTTVGGGMNTSFSSDGNYEYHELPSRLEAGTQNISGVIGLGKAIEYINQIGYEKIEEHEQQLKKYLLEKLRKIKHIKVYNQDSQSAIVVFNVSGVFPQDTAIYLNTKNICVRAGNHCAKMLKDELGIKNTCRISLYIYNTKEEIDKLVEALQEEDILKLVI